MTRRWLEDLAAEFWDGVGQPEPFPRQLERSIMLSCPVSIIKWPRLDPRQVVTWLRRRGDALAITTQDRLLNGCLIMHRGHGFIFVDGGLDPNEVRLTVAHEFAHYWADYEIPRRRIVRRTGRALLAVCDGARAVTVEDQLASTLAGVELGVHVHYMDRPAGQDLPEATRRVEATAQGLALELVAPWRTVLTCAQAQHIAGTDREGLERILEAAFGLPWRWAVTYARRLRPWAARPRAFSEALGL